MSVECIATYSKGFICSGGSGTLHIFEKTDDKYIYRKARSVSVWVDPNSNLVATTGADSVPNDILSMTLSPSEENVVCSTRTQQLYNLTLSAADLQGKVEYCSCRAESIRGGKFFTDFTGQKKTTKILVGVVKRDRRKEASILVNFTHKNYFFKQKL